MMRTSYYALCAKDLSKVIWKYSKELIHKGDLITLNRIQNYTSNSSQSLLS